MEAVILRGPSVHMQAYMLLETSLLIDRFSVFIQGYSHIIMASPVVMFHHPPHVADIIFET